MAHHVDEARRDRLTMRIDLATPHERVMRTDIRDAVAVNRYLAGIRFTAGAVVDDGIVKHHVMYLWVRRPDGPPADTESCGKQTTVAYETQQRAVNYSVFLRVIQCASLLLRQAIISSPLRSMPS